jgi:hypothetical protein
LPTSPNWHFEPAVVDCASAINYRRYRVTREYVVVLLGESRQIGGLAFQLAGHRARALGIRTVAPRALRKKLDPTVVAILSLDQTVVCQQNRGNQ